MSALGASVIRASRQASAAAARRPQQEFSDRSGGNGLCTSGATAGRCFPSLVTTSRKAARMPGGSGTVPGGRESGETGSDRAATSGVSTRRITQP
eukprot:6019181-Alexandrium_andersonii.AAC.1